MPTALPILNSAETVIPAKPAGSLPGSLHPGWFVALWAIAMLLVGALAYAGVGTGAIDGSLQMLTTF